MTKKNEKKTPYDVLVGDEYKAGDGQLKTAWTTVGVAFELDNGGFSVEPRPGIALTGRFIIKKREPRPSPECGAQ